MGNRNRSRKSTPWDNKENKSKTQEFLQMHYIARYEERHPSIRDSGEADMINSYLPKNCPYCGSDRFIRKGYDSNGIIRYRCSCGKTFKPLNLQQELFLIPEKSLSVNG